MQLAIAANEQIEQHVSDSRQSGPALKSPDELSSIVSSFAASAGWIDRVRLCAERRWYERLYEGPDYDIWAISWLPGQSTGFHDHGASAGAFIVATGVLEEHRSDLDHLTIYPGAPRAFNSDYAHDVRNASLAPAVSIHAYSPPLNEMNEYELNGNTLVLRRRTPAQSEEEEQESDLKKQQLANIKPALSVEQILAAARARLDRQTPEEAFEAATKARAVLVDIRPERQRAIEGSIAGALVVERNVLEWRLDPASSSRLPMMTDHDLEVIVFCSESYASSLAAASLQDLGLCRATDMIGGFQAWRAAGLPVAGESQESPAVHP